MDYLLEILVYDLEGEARVIDGIGRPDFKAEFNCLAHGLNLSGLIGNDFDFCDVWAIGIWRSIERRVVELRFT